MTGKSQPSLGNIFITLCIHITVNLRRVATPLDIDQKRSVLHKILNAKHLSSLRLNLGAKYISAIMYLLIYLFLLFCPCKICPFNLLYLLHHGVVFIVPLGCVGDPYLVALEYLNSATLATACPATVSLPIQQLMACHLNIPIIFHLCILTNLAVDWILYKGVHHGGDGRVKDEWDQEEKGKDTNDCSAAKEQGGIILDVLQT